MRETIQAPSSFEMIPVSTVPHAKMSGTTSEANLADYFAASKLRFNVLDVEATELLEYSSWHFLLTGGLRYAHISQDYSAVLANGAGAPLATLASGHNFNGAGPTVSLTGKRPIGLTNLYVFGSARGSVLFGNAKQSAVLGGTDADSSADAVAKLLEEQAAEQAAAHALPGAPQSLAPSLPSAEAETLYREGHAALIQKDYARAEATFGQLIAASPNDPLAGRAQFWIGEAYYAQNQYKSAADAFLKAYKTDEAGEKAPDALLKLGMALAGLGQKDAACSTFQELKAKFPKAPAPIPKEADTWRKKTGC